MLDRSFLSRHRRIIVVICHEVLGQVPSGFDIQ